MPSNGLEGQGRWTRPLEAVRDAVGVQGEAMVMRDRERLQIAAGVEPALG